jgi:excisionase family DNA binding protein
MAKNKKELPQPVGNILTIEEAACLLKVGVRAMYKLVNQGKIPARKVLNKWRFEKNAVLDWIGANENI